MARGACWGWQVSEGQDAEPEERDNEGVKRVWQVSCSSGPLVTHRGSGAGTETWSNISTSRDKKGKMNFAHTREELPMLTDLPAQRRALWVPQTLWCVSSFPKHGTCTKSSNSHGLKHMLSKSKKKFCGIGDSESSAC